jgi:hypothetical protein
MTTEGTGERSGSEHVVGREKPDFEEGEVAGRRKSGVFTCFTDGAINYFDDTSWQTTVACWRCGALNDTQAR